MLAGMPEAVAKPARRRHRCTGKGEFIQAVVVGGARWSRKIEDKTYFIVLRYGQERVDSKCGKGRVQERARNESFGNPRGDGVRDLGAIEEGGGGIGGE
jgi:hypothetical protein